MLKPHIIKLCGEITALSVFISNVTAHDISVNYSGHVNYFEMRIFENGWKQGGGNKPRNIYINLEVNSSEEELTTVKKELEKMLNDIYEIDSAFVSNSTI